MNLWTKSIIGRQWQMQLDSVKEAGNSGRGWVLFESLCLRVNPCAQSRQCREQQLKESTRIKRVELGRKKEACVVVGRKVEVTAGRSDGLPNWPKQRYR